MRTKLAASGKKRNMLLNEISPTFMLPRSGEIMPLFDKFWKHYILFMHLFHVICHLTE